MEINREIYDSLLRDSLQMAHDLKAPVMLLQGALSDLSSERSRWLVQASVEHLNRMSRGFSCDIKNKYVVALPREKMHEYVSLQWIVRQLKKTLKEFYGACSPLPKISLFNCLPLQNSAGLALEEVHVRAQKELLISVLLNVLKNAWEARCESREFVLNVGVFVEDKRLIVEFSDNGEGMSAADQSLLLRALKDEGAEFCSRKSSGWGVGLRSCVRTLEKWGAQLDFESREGKGTTVSLSLEMVSEAGLGVES